MSRSERLMWEAFAESTAWFVEHRSEFFWPGSPLNPFNVVQSVPEAPKDT